MALRPRPPCSTPGCQCRTVAGGRCDCCRSRRRTGTDLARGSPAARGYDHVWARRRLAYLVANPWCRLCPRAATVADHYPTSRRDLIAAGVADPDAEELLRPLCAACHNRATAEHQGGGWHRALRHRQ